MATVLLWQPGAKGSLMTTSLLNQNTVVTVFINIPLHIYSDAHRFGKKKKALYCQRFIKRNLYTYVFAHAYKQFILHKQMTNSIDIVE